jgi:hypothetical protein
MVFQNKIMRVFLLEHHGSFGPITRCVGRMIKPYYGKETQLRKEYREFMAWQDMWQPDGIDGTEATPMIDYDEED